jgi:hypothetical protein
MAAIDANILRCVLRLHLDPVGPAVRESQTGDGDTFAAASAEDVVTLYLAVPSSAAESDLCRVAFGAADRDVLLLSEDYWPRKFVLTFAEKDRAPAPMCSTACTSSSTVATGITAPFGGGSGGAFENHCETDRLTAIEGGNSAVFVD